MQLKLQFYLRASKCSGRVYWQPTPIPFMFQGIQINPSQLGDWVRLSTEGSWGRCPGYAWL